MGRESSDQTMAHSSIVLLQERFRQLQRVKEMREEKEMLRLFSESDTSITYNTHNHKPSHLCFQSELLHPLPQNVAAPAIPPSSHVTCLSLWPDSTTTGSANCDIINAKNSPRLGHVSDNTKKTHCFNNKSWLSKYTNNSLFYDVDDHDNESDVDTSLHL